jgi:Tol biopolymer transport system component/DNA-binding winged helix-turn-helix (wHTH) protein
LNHTNKGMRRSLQNTFQFPKILTMHKLNGYLYEFGEFKLDLVKRELRRTGEIVAMTPKVFDTLRVLVQNQGQVVSKDLLMDEIWGDAFVEESGLMRNISVLRKTLGDQNQTVPFIVTVPGQGYRFVAEVREVSDEEEDALIVLEQTRAKITIKETEDDQDLSAANRLLPLPPGSFFKRYQLIILGVTGLLILLIGGVFLFRSQRSTELPFQKIAIKRLTTNGRVTNAALSPDGKLFAFSQQEPHGQQSLKLEHIDGSGQIQLLQPADVVFTTLAFSPDGNRIYYNITGDDAKNNGLFRLPVFGGAAEKIKDNVRSRIVFSPDAKEFAFVRNDSANRKSSLVIAQILGDQEREIISRPTTVPFSSTSIAWSPDGKMMAVSALSQEGEKGEEIYAVTISDGSIKQVTSQEWNSVLALSWTKDSSSVITVAEEKGATFERQLWGVSYPDGKVWRIVSDLTAYSALLNILADNSALMAVQSQHFSNIWVAPADNLGAGQQITSDMLGKLTGWNGLEWTRDGKIVYTSFVGQSETLWSIDADGANQKQLIPEGLTNLDPSISADGRFLVFASNRGGSDEIWRAGGDGSGMKQLTTGGSNEQPDISPDGKWVVYRSSRQGSAALWLISIEGGEPHKLTESSASWGGFSPDGKFIACGVNRDSATKLAIISSDSGKESKLFDVPRTANFRLGIRWTPDGKSIAYRDWNEGIWKQELNGGEPTRFNGLPPEKLYGFGWSRDGKYFAYARGVEIRDVVLISNLK